MDNPALGHEICHLLPAAIIQYRAITTSQPTSANQGSGADTPFIALQQLFGAAGMGENLVHLNLGCETVCSTSEKVNIFINVLLETPRTFRLWMSGNVEKVSSTILLLGLKLPELYIYLEGSSHHPRSVRPLSKVSIRDTPAEAKVFEAELQNCAVSWLAS